MTNLIIREASPALRVRIYGVIAEEMATELLARQADLGDETAIRKCLEEAGFSASIAPLWEDARLSALEQADPLAGALERHVAYDLAEFLDQGGVDPDNRAAAVATLEDAEFEPLIIARCIGPALSILRQVRSVVAY